MPRGRPAILFSVFSSNKKKFMTSKEQTKFKFFLISKEDLLNGYEVFQKMYSK